MIDTAGVPGCTTCGTCCFSSLESYLRVAGVDYERLGEAAPVLTHFIGNRSYMRLIDGHCAALEVDPVSNTFMCSVYETRPDVCRWLERGSGQCRADRHEKSALPLIALRSSKEKMSAKAR